MFTKYNFDGVDVVIEPTDQMPGTRFHPGCIGYGAALIRAKEQIGLPEYPAADPAALTKN